jgi:anti-anti-sigma factor
MDQLEIESTCEEPSGIRVLRLRGPFTLPGVMDFQTIFRSLSDPVILIDLSEVPYMDSAALGALISVHTSSQRNKRQYAFSGVSERIRTLFDVSGVGTVLVTYPSLAEAREKFTAKAAAQ